MNKSCVDICFLSLSFLTDPATGFFVQIAQEDPSPTQTEAQGSRQSSCPRAGRQKPLLEAGAWAPLGARATAGAADRASGCESWPWPLADTA